MDTKNFEISAIFNEKDDIYRAFHCILALNTGDTSYAVDFYDYDNIDWNPALSTPRGKQLNISIKDTCQSFNWQSEPCQATLNDMAPFSFDLLKKKRQEEWTDLDYEIAKKFIECYGEFVLTGKRFYSENTQLGKAHLLNLKDILQKAEKSDKWISEKIAYLIKEEDYPRDQAIAIAYSMAGKSKNKKSLVDNFYDFVKGLINEGASKEIIKEILIKNFLENKENDIEKDFSNDLFGMIKNDYIVKHDSNKDCLEFDEINKNDINEFKDIIKAIVNKIISNDLEKGKKFPIGTVHNWGGKDFKKIDEGKWEEVKKPRSGEKKESGGKKLNETTLQSGDNKKKVYIEQSSEGYIVKQQEAYKNDDFSETHMAGNRSYKTEEEAKKFMDKHINDLKSIGYKGRDGGEKKEDKKQKREDLIDDLFSKYDRYIEQGKEKQAEKVIEKIGKMGVYSRRHY